MEYSTTKSAIKRIQRIVAQNVLKVAECAQQSTGSSRMSLIMTTRTRLAIPLNAFLRTEVLTKINQAANLDGSSASESTDETYDRYPESDHSAV